MGRSTTTTMDVGETPVPQDQFICNGCGASSSPTEEHLVHRDIARVLLAAAPDSPRRDVRPQLESGFFSGFVHSKGQDQPLGRVNFNAAIDNLLCGECNRHKAGPLEKQAATALQDFLFNDGAADSGVLRRWAWFFALKLWWYKRPTEELRTGVLYPLLSTLFRDGSSVALRVRVAHLAADPALYSYMWVAESDGAFFKYAMWITRGLVWIVVPSPLLQPVPDPVSRVPTVELMEAPRSNLPRIRPRRLASLPAVAKILQDDRIGELGAHRASSSSSSKSDQLVAFELGQHLGERARVGPGEELTDQLPGRARRAGSHPPAESPRRKVPDMAHCDPT